MRVRWKRDADGKTWLRDATVLISGIVFALGMLLTPTAAYAQADQKIIMRCTYDGYTDQTLDYVIDLAAKTISKTWTLSDPPRTSNFAGEVTGANDDKITWVFRSHDGGTDDETLDRYSGRIVNRWTMMPQGTNGITLISCQRRQKEF